MKPQHPTKRSELGAVADAIEVMAAVSGDPVVIPRDAGSLVVMIVAVMLGIVIWFGAFIVSVVIVGVFGLTHGPYVWLGNAIALAGIVGGLVAAAIVMFRIVRRSRSLLALSGSGDEPDHGGEASTPVAAKVSRPAISPTELRDLDARLAERKDDDSSRT